MGSNPIILLIGRKTTGTLETSCTFTKIIYPFTMKKLVLILCCGIASWQVSAQKPTLTIDKIMQDPTKWIGSSPSGIQWAPNSSQVYFRWNPERNTSDSLYQYLLGEGKPQKVSLAEQLRMIPENRSSNTDGSLEVFAKMGDLYLYFPQTNRVKQLTQTSEIEQDPFFSADGQSILFTKSQNIFRYDLQDQLWQQITDFQSGAAQREKKKPTNERWLEADQLGMMEVLADRKGKKEATEAYRKLLMPKGPKKIYFDGKRLQSARVSPTGKFVAYSLVEMPKDAQNTIVPNYVTNSGYTEDIPARTKVGSPLPIYTSFVYDIARDTVWSVSTKDLPGLFDKPSFLKDYGDTSRTYTKPRAIQITDFRWSPLGTFLIAQIRSQDNKDRWIVSIEPSTGKTTCLDRQHDEAWIGGPGIGWGGTLDWLDEQTVYFQSEESGYSHLYRYDMVSRVKKALTAGSFEVQSVQLSKDKKSFFITTNEVHPGQKHVYRLNIEGGKREILTSGQGANEVTFSPDEKWMAIRYSETNKPWELFIAPVANPAQRQQITQSLTPEFQAYPWRAAQVVTFQASDGKPVYARIYEPTSKTKNKKAVIFVHGAGYLQNAHFWWSQYFREYMFHNLLVDQGYTVLDIDYRASAGYGRDWRTGIYRHMGGKDLSDHVDGAAYLVSKKGIDPGKIGIYGGSYGGFITLMGLFTTPNVFKAGAALRPVTDWAAYNHGYTANILNEPQTDSLAYRKSSPIYFVNGLKNHLLICHGVVDVNVHFQDVVRLQQRLIEARKDNWEMAGYPVEDHGFVEPSSWADEYKRIFKLFEEKLTK